MHPLSDGERKQKLDSRQNHSQKRSLEIFGSYGGALNRFKYRRDRVNIQLFRVGALKNENIMSWLVNQMHKHNFYLKVCLFIFSIGIT